MLAATTAENSPLTWRYPRLWRLSSAHIQHLRLALLMLYCQPWSTSPETVVSGGSVWF